MIRVAALEIEGEFRVQISTTHGTLSWRCASLEEAAADARAFADFFGVALEEKETA